VRASRSWEEQRPDAAIEAGRLEARSRLERVSRGEDWRRMGWLLLTFALGGAKDVGFPRAWLFCDGFRSFAMRCP
jgi:hypothetical protein